MEETDVELGEIEKEVEKLPLLREKPLLRELQSIGSRNQSLISGFSYCLASCSMILLNKVVLSGYQFNAGISLMFYQVCLPSTVQSLRTWQVVVSPSLLNLISSDGQDICCMPLNSWLLLTCSRPNLKLIYWINEPRCTYSEGCERLKYIIRLGPLCRIWLVCWLFIFWVQREQSPRSLSPGN